MLTADGSALNPSATDRELTVRAILTGMVLGALLAPCNVYAGLKVGWSFNMSVAAALLGFAFWGTARRIRPMPEWGLRESNINQTAASSAAAIAGAGLVAPVPALTLLTGRELSLGALVLWTFTVSLVGVVVAIGMRRQLLEVDRLPFPAGIATAETLKQMYAAGRQARVRLAMLTAAAGLSGAVKAAGEVLGGLPRLNWSTAKLGGGATWANLGFAWDPSLLLIGFGAIIGPRAGASMLLGAVLAWGGLGPAALSWGWASSGPADPEAAWFGPMVEWLLWPGVAMMVVSSVVSFGWTLVGRRSQAASGRRARGVVRWRTWAAALAGMCIVGAAVQFALFEIPVWIGVLAVLSTLALAVVAGRVSGETGITPIGAMGKVTQLGFAAAAPADVTTNLMAANVTGGAASQCGDMLHDLKAGLLLGATPRHQAVAQVFGVTAGAVSGSLTYLALVPDPQATLISDTWPAPAVVTWKAVAELFAQGWDQLPPGAGPAMVGGGLLALTLTAAERSLPERWARWVPSPASMGLACVLPAWNSISMFVGAMCAAVLERVPGWKGRTVVVAAGLVAGESLVGVGFALARMLT